MAKSKNSFLNYKPSSTKAKNPGTNKMPATGLGKIKRNK